MKPTTLEKVKLSDFGQVLDPSEAMEPILAKSVRAALLEWLEEMWATKQLEEVGLEPRKKALFEGPPGCGKTTLAHHLAARLGLPLLVARSDRLIDAYIGSTGRNIGALFDAAERTERCVIFLDEFDSLGAKRTDVRQGADQERNNSVNVLLAAIERYRGILLAATNHAPSLDEAVWRRFDIQITIELPGQDEREKILRRYLKPYLIDDLPLAELARSFDGASPSLMRQWCEGLKRHYVIGPKVGWSMVRADVMAKLVHSFAPHPSLEKPRLWRMKENDPAVAVMPWPLLREETKAA